MDGVFELFFVGVLVLASILDAIARSRTKRRRMEEMERTEAEEEAGADVATAEAEWRPLPPENRTSDDREEEGAPRPPGAGSSSETADTMIPSDLWAILTGETRAPEPAPRPTPSAPPEPASAPGPVSRAPRPADVGMPRGAEERSPKGRTPSGRPSRGIPIPTEGPSLPEPSRVGRSTTPRRMPVPAGREAAFGLPEEGGSAWKGRVLREAAQGRRASRPSPLAAKLFSGKRRALQEAVVLREVLGPPAALRPTQDPWEGR